MAEDRLRLTILGGYLGSGKTTWARHQLHVGAFGPDVHVIVNEAAEVPVDQALLAPPGGLTLLAGGCCCCDGQQDLILALRKLCDARSSGHGPSRVLLETSGLADPGAILRAIQADPVLIHHIRVEAVLVAVDGMHAVAQIRSEPLGRRQIEVADRLIITKADEAADLDRLRATLRLLNPSAPITATVRGEERDLGPLDPKAMPFDIGFLDADLAQKPPIRPCQLVLPDGMDWSLFTLWLSALLHARGDDLVRVKGVIRTPAGRLLLQTVRKEVQAPEIMPEDAAARDNVVVFIGRGYEPQDLVRSLLHFTGFSPSAAKQDEPRAAEIAKKDS